MRPVSLSLPFPVPLHACFIKSKGGTGIPSKRYKAYQAAAEAAWRAQGSPKVPGCVTVQVSYCAPDRQPRDAGNMHKCLFDNLVRLGVIEDDSNRVVIAEATAWVPTGPACRVTVTPVAISAHEIADIPMRGTIT